MNEYINIQFQEGPVQEAGVNGCTIEDVIRLLAKRLVRFQAGPYPCRQNDNAIQHLEEARSWLLHRTADRLDRGVEGKYQA